MKAENPQKGSCLQRDNVEREEYVGAQSAETQENEETNGARKEPKLLEKILDRKNLNRAYQRVKANKGAPGIDGLTVDEALPWLKEHRDELLESIYSGKYKPSPVRRKEIPKPDGGVRKLGIPTVIDRIIQQAIAQQLTPIFEPLFSDSSYGYRPGRSAQQAMKKVKEYAEQGYIHAVEVDLSKYFDTLNHDLTLNMLRKEIEDKRVIDLIKKFLKSGVMENGIVSKTTDGAPQGGPLSPIISNIYLNGFDHEFESRGVKMIRYADDIILLAKSKRAAHRLLETSRRYLETKLKLKVNEEKSKVVSVFSIRNFKFLGFALGKNKDGVYIRVHASALRKAKQKLKELSSRNQGRNIRHVMANIKRYMQGWLAYYGIGHIKSILKQWDGWLRRRLRMYIWKQWKLPKTKVKNLRKLGIPDWQAYQWGNTRLGYWRIAGSAILTRSITNKRLAQAGYFNLSEKYESLH